MSFKSSALCLLWLKCWGLDLLVRSHSRISVGATRGSFWVMTHSNTNYSSSLTEANKKPFIFFLAPQPKIHRKELKCNHAAATLTSSKHNQIQTDLHHKLWRGALSSDEPK